MILLLHDFIQMFHHLFSLSQHTVVTVPGDHHVHLNNPEVVAPLVSDFLQTRVILQQHSEQTHKL